MVYRRLTSKDRCQIEALRRNGFGIRKIAKQLGCSPSTISREISCSSKNYSAENAARAAFGRLRSRKAGKFRVSGKLASVIRRKLLADWSPEQIVGFLRLSGKLTVSFQTIYNYIERDKLKGGRLAAHLRILRKQRKDRKKPNWHPFSEGISNRKRITERPKIVERRIRLGDIERDTVFGSHNGPLLLTMVDRKSRYVRIAWIPKKCSELIHQATVSALKNKNIKTITNDNGTEFARHQKTSQELKVPIFFSRAYASWERGTNENTNGLIRQYFPRKKTIAYMTPGQVRALERKLNSRPRKCLGFRTPIEIDRR